MSLRLRKRRSKNLINKEHTLSVFKKLDAQNSKAHHPLHILTK